MNATAVSAGNAAIFGQFANVAAALRLLEDAGALVLRITLGERQPLIEIDAQPPLIHGALAARITIAGVQRRTLAARVHGCTVQWYERHVVGAQAVRA
ncbi:MAG: hypothetical protein JSR26_04085 [Proteobacteria bacterium]|nr:hypothetical protein [Pseudomonadota bacterium]